MALVAAWVLQASALWSLSSPLCSGKGKSWAIPPTPPHPRCPCAPQPAPPTPPPTTSPFCVSGSFHVCSGPGLQGGALFHLKDKTRMLRAGPQAGWHQAWPGLIWGRAGGGRRSLISTLPQTRHPWGPSGDGVRKGGLRCPQPPTWTPGTPPLAPGAQVKGRQAGDSLESALGCAKQGGSRGHLPRTARHLGLEFKHQDQRAVELGSEGTGGDTGLRGTQRVWSHTDGGQAAGTREENPRGRGARSVEAAAHPPSARSLPMPRATLQGPRAGMWGFRGGIC